MEMPSVVVPDEWADAAEKRAAYDKLLDSIRLRNGESYEERIKAVGEAVVEAAAQ